MRAEHQDNNSKNQTIHTRESWKDLEIEGTGIKEGRGEAWGWKDYSILFLSLL